MGPGTVVYGQAWRVELIVARCSGKPTLRSGSAKSQRLPRQQRAHALQRTQFRSRSRHGHVLAPGTSLQYLSLHNGR